MKFTRVTLESFLAWKKRKVKEKKEAIIKDEEKKRTDYKAGRQIGVCIINTFVANNIYLRHLVCSLMAQYFVFSIYFFN